MRPPTELDEVQWLTLTHAYGSAEDVPQLIRALYQSDEEAADEAIHELYGTIHHQGTVYRASAPAVPFLAHAVLHAPGRRDDLLMLLTTLADHDPADVESPHWPGRPVAAVSAELCRVLPELLPCLGDPERVVRRAALRVVAAVAELLPAELRASAVGQVEAVYADDPVPAVRADATIVLSRFGAGPVPLDSPLPEVRLTAATLAAEQSGPPYPADLVEIIAEDGAEPDPGDDDFPWSGTTTPDGHLTRLLTRDPDAGLAVAARWIAAGDLGARGSWLAREITEIWRDRHPEVLDLLLAALPHQRDTRTLSHLLSVIGRWIAYLREPADDLRNTLHDYARSGTEAAEPGLVALVRSRDPRALELVLRRPDARALGAAVSVFPEAADRLIPAIRRELAAGAAGNGAIDLVAALAPFGAAADRARPELIECLRTRRAAVAAARQLGHNGVLTREIASLLSQAGSSTDSSLRAAAAVAHYRLTGETGPTVRTFESLLADKGPTHEHLSGLQPLGSAAAPLLPLVEPLLTARYEWTRLAAAEAHHWITGSPERAVDVFADLVAPTPVGLAALKALAAVGEVPEELRPTLRSFAFSPLRLLSDMPFSEHEHPDEELRTVARGLLALG